MKKVVIMRGLPSCGKSHTAHEIAQDKGIILSTDEFFYKIVCPEKPEEYSFDPLLLKDAHEWNKQRFKELIACGYPFVIVDNTNTTAWEMYDYASHAILTHQVEIAEPTSYWWLAIRKLLKDKEANSVALDQWAILLEEKSRETHNVPANTIRKMMDRWENDLNVHDILRKD